MSPPLLLVGPPWTSVALVALFLTGLVTGVVLRRTPSAMNWPIALAVFFVGSLIGGVLVWVVRSPPFVPPQPMDATVVVGHERVTLGRPAVLVLAAQLDHLPAASHLIDCDRRPPRVESVTFRYADQGDYEIRLDGCDQWTAPGTLPRRDVADPLAPLPASVHSF